MAARPLPKSAAPTSSPRLPSVSCPPEKEFADRWGATGTQAWYPWVPLRVQRVSRLALNAMFDRCGVICRRVAPTPTHVATHSRFRRGVVALLLTGSSVLGISSVEGILALREVTSANWTFIPGYAALQMLPSIVWASTPADVVAAAMGFDADPILRDWAHGASPHTTADAARQIASAHLQATRSVIAGFMIIAQILRGVSLTVRSGALYRVRSRARTAPSPRRHNTPGDAHVHRLSPAGACDRGPGAPACGPVRAGAPPLWAGERSHLAEPGPLWAAHSPRVRGAPAGGGADPRALGGRARARVLARGTRPVRRPVGVVGPGL